MPGRNLFTYNVVFKRIVGQRVRGDKTYYKVQWKGQVLTTWELEENLNPREVAEFKRTTSLAEAGPSTSNESTNEATNRQAERVLGMYEVNGELMFKMKLATGSKFVPTNEAKLKWPQAVIKYYEQQIVWL